MGGRAAEVAREPAADVLEQAAELLSGSVAVLTGAGISTDSGIPDYRGAGAPKRTPMTIQQFLAAESFRKRYWAGSYLGGRGSSRLRRTRATSRSPTSRPPGGSPVSSPRTSTACT